MKTQKPSAGAFREYDVSCDWNKFCTPESSVSILSKTYKVKKNPSDPGVFKDPDDYFLCSLLIENIIDLEPKQEFIHAPVFNFPKKIGVPNNRAHSLILGEKSTIQDQILKDDVSVRGQLAHRCQWVYFDPNRLKQKMSK